MSNATQDIVLNVSNLTKIYGRDISLGKWNIRRRVVGAENVSFDVKKGEIFGFLGPNGSGKTTTIRSILDYLHIQEGNITIFDLDHKKSAIEIRKRIGYVPGDMALYEDFTGLELIKYFNKFREFDNNFLEELKSIFKVDLTSKVKTLSKGNRQQIGLILALAHKPEFLILDEPSSGLDPLMTAQFHRILKRLKSEGITIFLSSHDLSEVQSICDRVGIIKEGKMILVEEMDSLKSKFLQIVDVIFENDNFPSEDELLALETVLDITVRNTHHFTLRIKDDVNEIVQFLSTYSIKRLEIKDATLEEIFLHYYE
ncbi:MAG: ABC transporter ATP-binding protein [Asgard group archaeon]|nr:ABC transporter ATP-binding protein [Asgard group archaeon]